MNKDKVTKTFLGHPIGLLNLFSTEFCERFSYYGMRAILVFYVYSSVASGGLGLSKQDALYVMTLFGSAVYMLSVLGGWLADRVIGAYYSILLGGAIIAVGHIVLGLPFTGVAGLFIALVLIAIGTGLLKPNVSSMVGTLYTDGDRRRAAGFNIFVLGINIGSFFSPIIVGGTQKVAGFHVAFTIPAVFMIVGLIVFYTLTKSTLGQIDHNPASPILPHERGRILTFFVVLILSIAVLVTILIALNILTLESFSIITPLVSVAIVTFLFASMISDKSLSKDERNKTISYIAIFVIAVVFWAIEELQSSVFATLAESRANNNVAGFHFPESWYQSVNPFVIIIGAPLLAIVWTKLKKQPSIIMKMTSGLFLTCISFLIPAFAFASVSHTQKVSPLFLIIPIAMFSLGELFVSPIGLSATTELAAKKYDSRLMAIWFLSNTLGQGINSFCVRFYDDQNPSPFFFGYAIVAAIIIVIVLLLLKPLKRLMGNVQ
ncbi:MAG: oligopeptide:H+ symporter [Candidatus Ancillula sp.]|jgi:POT family proton-dependent oligopeptide transporter|nr:oligopeptide:H+ symporter [Candidatus Ancillula sp.]